MTRSRKECRSGPRCTPRTLCEALYCQAHHSDRSLREIAEHPTIDLHESSLRNFVNPDDAAVLPLRFVEPLIALTPENPAVTRYLASVQDGLFVPRVSCDGLASELHESMARVLRELSQAVEVVNAKLRDQQITDDDLPDIERECDDVAIAIQATKELARRLAQPRSGGVIRSVMGGRR